MAAIRKALSAVVKALGQEKRLLSLAQVRYQANRKRAFLAHCQKVHDRTRSDNQRAKGHLVTATRADKAGDRAQAREQKNHARAQWWLGQIKVHQASINKLTVRAEDLKAKLDEWIKTHGVQIKGNHVTGGTAKQRRVACALASAHACAMGHRSNFYSQEGIFDVAHCITGPGHDCRDDCSSWFTSVYYSCGDKDPNGGPYGGITYTGSLEANGKVVDHPVPGGAVLYGSPGATHHVELIIAEHGIETIGHGSSPVDPGVYNLFGDGNYRFVVFD